MATSTEAMLSNPDTGERGPVAGSSEGPDGGGGTVNGGAVVDVVEVAVVAGDAVTAMVAVAGSDTTVPPPADAVATLTTSPADASAAVTVYTPAHMVAFAGA